MAIVMTHNHAVAGGRRVHALHGGGEGMKDAAGRDRYLAGVTWCGVEKRSRVALVETCAPVTCKICLAALEAFERRRAK